VTIYVYIIFSTYLFVKVMLKFDHKMSELKKQLKDNMAAEMKKQAYQSISDKIVSSITL